MTWELKGLDKDINQEQVSITSFSRGQGNGRALQLTQSDDRIGPQFVQLSEAQCDELILRIMEWKLRKVTEHSMLAAEDTGNKAKPILSSWYHRGDG